MPPAFRGDQDVVEVEVELRQIDRTPELPIGGEDPPEVRIGGEERGLDQRRMGDGVGHLAAFGLAAPAFDAHGHELGRALAVADDRLRELPRDVGDRRLELEQVARERARPGRGRWRRR